MRSQILRQISNPSMTLGVKKKTEYAYWCYEGNPLFELGCNSITDRPLLGGLSPSYPIAACTHDLYEVYSTEGCIFTEGSMFFYCERYVIFRNGNFELISSLDEFREIYAPVESPEEALGFALVSDNLFALYGQSYNDNYIYSVQDLEDTFVESTTGGYLVHVFYKPSFGCPPFETEAVELKVTTDGYVKEIDRHPVFNDPSWNSCLD